MRIFRNALIAMCMSPMLGICMGAPFYIAEPIEAWVVDADTGQPIEGAIVAANWELVTGGFDGPGYKGELEIKETVTGGNGRFYFEGFSKANPNLWELRNRDPHILIFKNGYEYKSIVNQYTNAGSDTPGFRRSSQIHGKQIRLKKFEANENAYATHLGSLKTQARFAFVNCNWKYVPRLVATLIRNGEHLRANKVPHGLPSLSNLESATACGDATNYLKEFLK